MPGPGRRMILASILARLALSRGDRAGHSEARCGCGGPPRLLSRSVSASAAGAGGGLTLGLGFGGGGGRRPHAPTPPGRAWAWASAAARWRRLALQRLPVSCWAWASAAARRRPHAPTPPGLAGPGLRRRAGGGLTLQRLPVCAGPGLRRRRRAAASCALAARISWCVGSGRRRCGSYNRGAAAHDLQVKAQHLADQTALGLGDRFVLAVVQPIAGQGGPRQRLAPGDRTGSTPGP